MESPRLRALVCFMYDKLISPHTIILCNADEADTSPNHKFYQSLPDVDVEADEEVHVHDMGNQGKLSEFIAGFAQGWGGGGGGGGGWRQVSSVIFRKEERVNQGEGIQLPLS